MSELEMRLSAAQAIRAMWPQRHGNADYRLLIAEAVSDLRGLYRTRVPTIAARFILLDIANG